MLPSVLSSSSLRKQGSSASVFGLRDNACSRLLAFGCRVSARLPPTRRAFHPPAGGRVTFLCWPKEK
jgi:hypothetical protein